VLLLGGSEPLFPLDENKGERKTRLWGRLVRSGRSRGGSLFLGERLLVPCGVGCLVLRPKLSLHRFGVFCALLVLWRELGKRGGGVEQGQRESASVAEEEEEPSLLPQIAWQ
jgi:hypothetical protein